ncbi:MAG TPA: Calx-beta domain-containing protein, partial [Chloroflexota bacterium]|nr:Calx-beta domain-containing protein [Chloroflexota bacterium]
ITAANATVVDGSGEVKIQDDDPAPTPPSLPALSIHSVSLPEGSLSQNVAFTVTLSAPSMLPVTVQWATTSDSTDGPSMATEGVDYVKIPLDTLTFDPGQTSRLVYVIVNGDTAPEPNERYYVKLANPTNATIAVGTGVGTILNDD